MLIINGKIITWERENQILNDHAIYIEGSVIKEIGTQADLLEKYPREDRLDAKGQYVMPGNICAHTHFYGVFSRGMAIPGAAPKDFPEILDKLWWPLDKALTLKDTRYSAYVCIADAIRHGTTTLFDHHASDGHIRGSLYEIYEVVKESGIRASLCYEVSDRGGLDRAEDGIRENQDFLNFVAKEKPLGGRVNALFGMHASLTISDETMEKSRAAVPEGTGFHLHVAEHPVDEYDSLNKYGKRIVDRLKEHEILGPNTIIAHGVHIDAQEMNLIAESGTWVTHQPRSNMNNAVGVADIASMMRVGCKVGLGNDGFSNAMWEEWKAAYLVHKLWHRDPRWMGGYDVVEMAVYNNAALASQIFPVTTGVLREGAEADVIFVDYYPITPLSTGNLPWHILFGFRDSMVTMTMAAGKVLMKDRELLTLDEEKINFETQKLVPEVWKRYQAQF
ncbi:MAG: putative aminohydrolase SsnA [Anaerolineaceae bacterium]|nr:putative aminohydrolase SsnA [Anaerolineaceae bacterium]